MFTSLSSTRSLFSSCASAFSQNSRLTVHTQRVDSYYYERERTARFEDCMRSKGYDVD